MTQAVSGQQTHKVTLTPYDAGGEWTTTHKVTLTPYDAGGEWTTTHKVTLTPYDAGGEWTTTHKVTLTPYDAGGEWTTKTKQSKPRTTEYAHVASAGHLPNAESPSVLHTINWPYHHSRTWETSLHKS